MWDEITRRQYGREGLRYASDTTDEEWALIEPFMPGPARGRGRPRTTDLRAVVNAIFYLAQSGCQWRLLPKDFPPFTTVQRYFYPWRDVGLWRTINHAFAGEVLELLGKGLGCTLARLANLRAPVWRPGSNEGAPRWRGYLQAIGRASG